jgi:FkbM family methyltransferase
MLRVRTWASQLFLQTPASLRSLREVPVLGSLIRSIGYWILPAGVKTWIQVETGPAVGVWLKVDPRTGQMYLRGAVEPAVQQILMDRLRPGMVFYDLGANIGFFSLLAARMVGVEGKVFSFEPDPQAADRLQEHVERNGSTNITVIDHGVWSVTGQVRFLAANASSPDRGTGHFKMESDGVMTRCIALDDFVLDASVPNGIKCDVEGAEIEVLRGAANMLVAHRPWILCETHSQSNDRAARELLTSFGYTVESVDGNHILALP